jgi:hypothetical protein
MEGNCLGDLKYRWEIILKEILKKGVNMDWIRLFFFSNPPTK